MSARCATAFTTMAATGLLLSTLGGTTPHYIWNASKSVPIGLYRVQPATVLAVTELVAVQPPDLLAAFLDLNGYLPMGIPMLKRVLALPGQTVCRNGLTIAVDGIDVGQAHERDGRGRPLPIWHGCQTIADGDVFVMNWQSAELARQSVLWAVTHIRGDRQGSTRLDRRGVIMRSIPAPSVDCRFSETPPPFPFRPANHQQTLARPAKEKPYPCDRGLDGLARVARTQSARYRGDRAFHVHHCGIDVLRIEGERTDPGASSIHRPLRQLHRGSFRPLYRAGALDRCHHTSRKRGRRSCDLASWRNGLDATHACHLG